MESLTADHRVPRKPPLLALLQSMQLHGVSVISSTGEDMNDEMLKRIDHAAKVYMGKVVRPHDLAITCGVSIDCGRRMLRAMERLGMSKLDHIGKGKQKFHKILRKRK